mgnify:CR=1 FL=1
MKNVKIGIVGCGNWGKKILKNLLELNVLYKVFGRKYRGAKPSDPFIRIRNELYRKTAKISEPS